MAILEQLILPGLIFAIVALTLIAMRGDARAHRKLAEAMRADAKTSAQSGHEKRPERPSQRR
jgi:hypothetical protein